MKKKITKQLSLFLLFCFIAITGQAQESPSLKLASANNNFIHWNETNTLIETNPNFTIEMWVKASTISSGSNGRLIYCEGVNSNSNMFRLFGSTSKVYIRPNGVSGSEQLASTTSIFGAVAEWHHIAVVGTTPGGLGTVTTLKLYIDGVEEDTNTYTRNNADYDRVTLGNLTRTSSQTSTYAFDGEIDEFRTWSRALSASEINNNMCTPANSTGLTKHLKLNEASGTTALDEITSTSATIQGTSAAVWTTNSSCITNSFIPASGVWNVASNWSHNRVPLITDNVIIPTGSTTTIGGTVAANTKKLTIEGALSISSGGALIVSGSSSGNVTYNRNISTPAETGDFDVDKLEGWHLMSSPVSGQDYGTSWADTNGIASGSSTNRGIATYNNTVASNNWVYSNGASSTFATGTGYSLKRTSTGDVSFTGTINTTNITDVAITTGSTGYNLVGNPFTAFINSGNFLTTNTGLLDSQTIWVWNPSTKNYDAKLSSSEFKVAPGQGFFVKAASNGDLVFNENTQSHQSDTFLKSPTSLTSEITVNITDGNLNRYAKVNFQEGSTKGFDNGYDGETFDGVANSFNIYTQLLANNSKKYQIQSLSKTDIETTTIPLGLKVNAGKEITFTVNNQNLPEGIKVYLEDRLLNVFTLLNEVNSNYKVTINNNLNTTGRFYLITTASALSSNDISYQNINIYKTNNNSIRITGLQNASTNVSLFNILGKKVMSKAFEGLNNKNLHLPNLASGVYIVKLQSENGKLNKKIILE